MDCVASLTPAAAADPLAAVQRPPEGASLVELRLDLFPGLDPAAAVAACPLPVLCTLRSAAEGGKGPDDPTLRRPLLAAAREAGAAMVDLEQERDLPLLGALGLAPEQVVLSWHDPGGVPDNLVATAAAMLATPAALVKVVTTATTLRDLEPVLRLYEATGRRRRRLMAFAMGPVGIASRFLAPLLGAPLAFVAWAEGAAAAPGQPTVARLRSVIGHLRRPPDRVYGVVGANVASSLSPELHSAGFAALTLPYLFLPLSVPEPADLSELFVPRGETLLDRCSLPVHGLAVTAPYKTAAARAASLAAPRVRRADAANTLILKPGRLIAENTDADGVVGSLTAAGVDPAGHRALIQGTGGAARGAAVGLDLAGADVVLRGRDAARTRAVAEELGVAWIAPDDSAHDATLLVNATPLGSAPGDDSPFSEAEVTSADAVLDMVYAAHTTALAELAGARGTTLLDGREMLLHQGYAQFAAFTGELPPKAAMRAAVGLP